MGIVSNTEQYFNDVYTDTVRAISRYVVSKCGNILDTEDILQNIYTRFYQRILKKGFTDIENAEAFLINIAKFECKTYFTNSKKSNKTTSFTEYSEEEMVNIEADMAKPQKSLEDLLCNKIMAKQIFEDIANGDPQIGQIFYLHFVCDMKLDEIAAETGLKLSTVKNKLYRTIEKQKKKFNIR